MKVTFQRSFLLEGTATVSDTYLKESKKIVDETPVRMALRNSIEDAKEKLKIGLLEEDKNFAIKEALVELEKALRYFDKLF